MCTRSAGCLVLAPLASFVRTEQSCRQGESAVRCGAVQCGNTRRRQSCERRSAVCGVSAARLGVRLGSGKDKFQLCLQLGIVKTRRQAGGRRCLETRREKGREKLSLRSHEFSWPDGSARRLDVMWRPLVVQKQELLIVSILLEVTASAAAHVIR